jgi:hypothetical protein
VGLKRCKEAGNVPASLLIGVVALLAGCGSQVSPTAVTTGLVLSCPNFQTNVFPVLKTSINGKACSDGGCHYINYTTGTGGTTGGGFKVDPNALPNSSEMQKNYLAARGFSDLASPASSRLLLKPMGDPGVGGHGGGTIIVDGDVYYLAIYGWISSQVQGPSACYP